jgi:dihydrolipoamide dehydrogenase
MAYDALIIGGGPGGYVCALRSAHLGLRVALIEEKRLGGVCLHWGCIPTKALYAATRLLRQASTATEMGIEFDVPRIDVVRLAAWKDGVVARLAGGIADLVKAAGIDVIADRARLAGPHAVRLSRGETLEAANVVLATGSSPIEIPGFSFSHPRIWSSDDALALEDVPPRLAIVGGGVIGLELGTIYRRLGSDVTIIELLPDVLPTLDVDRRAVAAVKRGLVAAGIRILTGVSAASFADRGDSLTLTLGDGSALDVERVLIAVGRRPNCADLGLETVGLEPDRRGALAVGPGQATAVPGVYAIGDLTPGPMLAHKASAEGIAVAHTLAGVASHTVPAEAIPQVVFTDPEMASVGLSETTARATYREVVVGRFSYAGLGKALGMRESEGFFQVVADAADHRILGVTIVGAEASDLLAEGALAVENGLTLEQVVKTVHAHPTLPEGFLEAAENALGCGIHTAKR